MRKIRKANRHIIYIILHYEIEQAITAWPKDFYRPGFCLLLGNLGLENYPYDGIYSLPELIKRRPKSYWAFWFDRDNKGMRKRLAILDECIKETA